MSMDDDKSPESGSLAENELTAAAYHQAGHAVMVLLVGNWIREGGVVLSRNAPGSGSTDHKPHVSLGDAWGMAAHREVIGDGWKRECEAEAMIAISGRMAEAIRSGEITDGSTINEHFGMLLPAEAMDEDNEGAAALFHDFDSMRFWLEDVANYIHRARGGTKPLAGEELEVAIENQYYPLASRVARLLLLPAAWSAVTEIANLLLRDYRASDEQVTGIFQAHGLSVLREYTPHGKAEMMLMDLPDATGRVN